jgi:hypothetical protein
MLFFVYPYFPSSNILMKRFIRFISLSILSFYFLVTSAFTTINDGDKGFCDDVKKITAAFNNKEFDKLKGKEIVDESAPNDKQWVSAIELKGYFSQMLYENEREIYFGTLLNEDFKDAAALQKGLEALVARLEKCLDIKMEYSETRSFRHYTALLDSGIEVKLSGNYPDEKRRYISLSVSYKKN